ncbi:MAG: OmpH family outer membrane protein [Myxococcales bacterium]|nr:OmpH family outer membrane protein [Myxococcales bacterium]
MLSAALLAPFVLPTSNAAAADYSVNKVAVVEVQRLLLETTQGSKAKKDLEKKFTKGQAKLDGKNKDLQKQVEDLQAKAAMLSQAELMRRQEALGIKYQEVQQLYMELQEDISNSETMLVEKIYKNAQTVVDTIAKDEGIEVVLVKSPMSILYANPKIDITNRVIVAYDKKFK